MNPNNPEQLLNKYNAVLKTNIVMAEAIGNYSREVMLLKRGNERLSNSNQRFSHPALNIVFSISVIVDLNR